MGVKRKITEEKSSNSSVEDLGNTSKKRQISPSKHWCFTLNGYDIQDIDEFIHSNVEVVEKYVFQEEEGKGTLENEGTRHLQGYLKFAEKKRPHSVFSNKRIHWEVCRNVSGAIAYCQKKETQVDEPYYRGLEPAYDIDIDLYAWQQEIYEILKGPIHDREIIWVWDAQGGTGKTLFSKWLHLKMERTVVLSGSAHDMKNAIVQYEETNNELPRIVIINIPRMKNGNISYVGIEEVKDCFFFSGKYKGGNVCGRSPHVVVFSNSEPKYEALSLDRWRVHAIDNTVEMVTDESNIVNLSLNQEIDL